MFFTVLSLAGCSLFNPTRTLTITGCLQINGTNINFNNYRTKLILLDLKRKETINTSAILKNDSTGSAAYSVTLTLDSKSDGATLEMDAYVKTYFKDTNTGQYITNGAGERCFEVFVSTNTDTQLSVNFSNDPDPVSRTINFAFMYYSYELGIVPANAVPVYGTY